jgi:inosine-uridine nucleoside N-ribohydrolase
MPLVIDTDPGIDDVVALALAARSPELELLAVTTTYGNAPLSETTRNAKRLLKIADRRDVPVRPGADRPLRRPLVTAPETHGPTGVGYAEVRPAPPVEADPRALLDVLGALDRPAVLVTLGPLTNLAHALALDADLVRNRVSRHLGMFGNLCERGNTNRWADFNAWCDPEAAAQVLTGGLGTMMVGLDVTRRMTYSAEEIAAFETSPDPLARWLGAALRFYVEFHRGQEGLDGCVVNDVLPVGELLAPGLLTLAQFALDVNLGDGEERGRTTPTASGTATAVAMQVDVGTMRRLLLRVFPPAATNL